MAENDDIETMLLDLQSGIPGPVTCDTEHEWRQVWMDHDLTGLGSLSVAVIGGALADRLAWVFHAGYQGMMRHAFPFCPLNGWASYLVAEDKTGEYPGTVLTRSVDGATLSGFKSWVAGSEHVDHLIIRVADAGDDALVTVDRDDPGVTLSSRDKPGFLADLSQGFAAFENVRISDDQMFTSEHLPEHFAQSEPHHVLSALNACFVSHTIRLKGDESIATESISSLELAQKLMAEDIPADEYLLGIADLDAATTETARRFEANVLVNDKSMQERWRRDRGLVNMFSRGLQKRASRLREG